MPMEETIACRLPFLKMRVKLKMANSLGMEEDEWPNEDEKSMGENQEQVDDEARIKELRIGGLSLEEALARAKRLKLQVVQHPQESNDRDGGGWPSAALDRLLNNGLVIMEPREEGRGGPCDAAADGDDGGVVIASVLLDEEGQKPPSLEPTKEEIILALASRVKELQTQMDVCLEVMDQQGNVIEGLKKYKTRVDHRYDFVHKKKLQLEEKLAEQNQQDQRRDYHLQKLRNAQVDLISRLSYMRACPQKAFPPGLTVNPVEVGPVVKMFQDCMIEQEQILSNAVCQAPRHSFHGSSSSLSTGLANAAFTSSSPRPLFSSLWSSSSFFIEEDGDAGSSGAEMKEEGGRGDEEEEVWSVVPDWYDDSDTSQALLSRELLADLEFDF